MIAELNKWLSEQEASIAEEQSARRGSTMQAYSVGFTDAIRRLREWVTSHVGVALVAGEPIAVRCRCGGVAAGSCVTHPAPGLKLVSTVCRCGRPISLRFEESRVPDGPGTCDGCGEVLDVLAGVVIVHTAPVPVGVRGKAARVRCAGAGRPPR